MPRNKKHGCRPPSKRFHARPISATSITNVRIPAWLEEISRIRKQKEAAATRMRYARNSNAAVNFDDAVSVAQVLPAQFIALRMVSRSEALKILRGSAPQRRRSEHGPSSFEIGLRTKSAKSLGCERVSGRTEETEYS